MNLQLIGGLIGFLIHIPLLIGIWKGSVKQSFASYGLWSLLDFIAAYAIYHQGGNFWLSFLFAIGAGLASLSLLAKKCFTWGNTESVVLGLVIVCVYIQYTAGEFYAMIASVGSLTLASIPQTINTYRKPEETPTFVYVVFTIASLLSLLGAKNFALEQILYPASASLMCITIMVLSMRKAA